MVAAYYLQGCSFHCMDSVSEPAPRETPASGAAAISACCSDVIAIPPIFAACTSAKTCVSQSILCRLMWCHRRINIAFAAQRVCMSILPSGASWTACQNKAWETLPNIQSIRPGRPGNSGCPLWRWRRLVFFFSLPHASSPPHPHTITSTRGTISPPNDTCRNSCRDVVHLDNL